MTTIVWILWALQLGGAITMDYSKLWLITVSFLFVGTILNLIKHKASEKLVQMEIDKCGDVKDDAATPTLLMLILRKIATK